MAKTDSYRNLNNPDEVDIAIPLSLQPHMWALALQQILLFVLIIGRWMLPKGDLTRDQLSQLLLVYIGIAADILEFCTEGLKMKETRCNIIMVVWILGIWTWSLLQFTLGLTVTKARKGRVASSRDMAPRMNIMCCETEVWGILVTVIMQDGPFLALRLYVLVVYDAINQMMIFFTCKNMLVVLLQFYRLLVVFVEKPGRDPKSVIGRIQRFRRPNSRYHSGGVPQGMPSERDASTTKLLSVDGEASNGMPLLDNLTADGRLRHSVNMANRDEMFSHTPQYPERFPGDIPVVHLPDDLNSSVDSIHSNSDYENLHTPRENGDVEHHFFSPDFPDMPSVYDSDEEVARRERMAQFHEEDETGNMKKKKKTKEDKKKEKNDKKKQKDELKKEKEEQKRKEKEDKKKEEDEKKKAKEEKKMEEKRAKNERRQSLKDSKKMKGDGKADGDKFSPIPEDKSTDNLVAAEVHDKGRKDQSSPVDDAQEAIVLNRPPGARVRPPLPAIAPTTAKPISPSQSPPKSPPKSPSLVHFEDM